jgi:hypothetical protein
MVDEVRGNKSSRSRSAEARDPNRPVDVTTGEKEGLGTRTDVDVTPGPEAPVVTTPMEPPATETPPSSV